MTREEILAEMVKVAEAMERPGLKAEQVARGKAKYDELEAKLKPVVNVYPEPIKNHVDKIRETLAKKP